MLLLTGGSSSFLDLITVLLIFVFVIAITLFTTKYIANYQKVQNAGKNIEVVETYKIAQTKYIQLVKVGAKYVAIAVSKDTVTLLAELGKDEIEFPDTNDQGKSFKEILASLKVTKKLEKTESLKEEE